MSKKTIFSKLMYSISLLTILWANSAQAGSFGANLVVNGGAEAQAFLGYIINDVTGWVGDGHWGVYTYQATNTYFPLLSDPGPSDRGTNFFWGGRGSQQSSAYQDIDLSFAATEIDAGTVSYDFSGWLGGLSTLGDSTVIAVTFYSASGQPLGNDSIGPVTVADRHNTTGLQQRSATGVPPVGTRSARVQMTMTSSGTSTTYGNADNIELVLTSSSGTGGGTDGGTDVVSSSVLRFFNWAEDILPDWFAPRRPQAGVISGYQYRCYQNTAACLVVGNDRLLYIGPYSNNQAVDLGAFSDFLNAALAAGY